MFKNLIPVIMKELNLQVGEEFKIDGIPYRFTHDNLEFYYSSDDKWYPSSDIIIAALVLGKKKITKFSFEPKVGEMYWTYVGDWTLHREFWDGDAYDCIQKGCGCVFRTQMEAKEALPTKYKELTGKEWMPDEQTDKC